MELYQLRTFACVARLGNVTRAALELHLSQSTVSGQIKALEDEFMVALFARKASGVELTAAGAELLPRAERLLGDAQGLLSHAHRLSQQSHRKVRVGTVIDAGFLRVGNLLSNMRAAHPNIEIETHHGLSGWVMKAVRAGEIDCGFFVGPITHKDVTGTTLTTINYRIVAPIEWAEQIKDAGWAEIAAMPWVWAPDLGSYPQIAGEMFREHGVEPRKVAIADRESTIIDFVTSGVGLALLRDSVALQIAESKRLAIWKHGSKTSPLSFIHLMSNQDDPAIVATTNAVRAVWAA